MGRAPCCDKTGLKKGPWTPEEDQKLVAYIQSHGHGSWRALPKNAGLLRCGKSCRLRWTNYLRPDIKRGRFTAEEEQMIIQLHAILGNRWSAIAGHLAGRTDNEIKNYWNTHLKKRLLQMGIDPVTHKPRLDFFDPFEAAAAAAAAGLPSPFLMHPGSNAISHMAQWENARLEAEARLAREYMRFGGGAEPDLGVPDAEFARYIAAAAPPAPQYASDLASQLYASSSEHSPASTLCSLDDGFTQDAAAGMYSSSDFWSPSSTLDGGVVDSSSLVEDRGGQEALSVLEWPDSGPAQSKDYWSNVLKLVGSPS